MKPETSTVISMRLPPVSSKRLKRMAAGHGWTPSEASARLVEEGLRRAEFAFIDFRDSPGGRQAYLMGSSLAVWEVMMVARSYRNETAAVAKHLRWPEAKVQAAFNYARVYPDEINDALASHDAMEFETLSQMLPAAKEFVVSAPAKSTDMLKLLLDEHVSPDVAEGLIRRHKAISVVAMPSWDDGRFLGMPDAVLLTEAAARGLTLVTYDRKTIPPLLKSWAEANTCHGGVIFVDEKTIPPSDIGGLVHALQKLFQDCGKLDWADRVMFLRR